MELYLKSYSQSKFWSKFVFKIKIEKKTFQTGIHFRSGGNVLCGFTSSLKPRGGGAGSLTVGPGGPLVMFDQSPSLPFLWPNRGGSSDDVRRRMAASFGKRRPFVGSGDRDGHSGGRYGLWGGRSCRRRASQRTVVVGQSGFSPAMSPDRNRARGWIHEVERKLLVKRVGRGRLWWRRNGRDSGGGWSCRR